MRTRPCHDWNETTATVLPMTLCGSWHTPPEKTRSYCGKNIQQYTGSYTSSISNQTAHSTLNLLIILSKHLDRRALNLKMSPGSAALFSIVVCCLLVFQSSQCSPNFWRPTLPPTLPPNPSAPFYKSKLSLLRLKIPAQTEHSYFSADQIRLEIFLKFQARYSYKKKRVYYEWLKSIKQLSKLTLRSY